MPLACVVATTTASVLLLNLKCVDGRFTIQWRNFKTSQGLLGSIGRRMSTLIFGSSPVQSLETRLVKLLAAQRDQNTLDVQILCSQSLQYWQVSRLPFQHSNPQHRIILADSPIIGSTLPRIHLELDLATELIQNVT